jgi:hypothetical protein
MFYINFNVGFSDNSNFFKTRLTVQRMKDA